MSGAPLTLLWHEGARGAKPAAIDAVVQAFTSHDQAVVRTPITDTGALDTVLKDNVGKQLVLAGGDGSMHYLAARIVGLGLVEDVMVSLVPLGSGNDLARNLGIPLAHDAAVEHALQASERRIDVAIADDGDIAVNSIHIGLGASTARVADRIKPVVGSLAYSVAGVVVGLRPRTWVADVKVDGVSVLPADGGKQVLMIGVGLGTYAGGGVAITPGAASDDGLLHVLVAAPKNLIGKTTFSVALLRGKQASRSDCVLASGHTIEITALDAPWDHDGEARPGVSHRVYGLVTNGLRFRG